MRVALAHDYLTQRGGAERVAEIMVDAFPGAPLHTTLYDPAGTFPEFAAIDVRPSALNRVRVLRRHHRLALPLLATAASGITIDADVLIASSSGWAHGMRTTGRKVVYCHAPARWLYQRDRYLGGSGADAQGLAARLRRDVAAGVLSGLAGGLRQWDQEAAHSAHRYLVNSTEVRDAVQSAYGIAAEVLPPPPALLPDGPLTPIDGIEPGFVLCVARLLPYKNIDVVIEAINLLPYARLVVVGEGPERPRLLELAARTGRTQVLGRVTDEQLRWLYASTSGFVTASHEDYGLAPLEAASFGRPATTLRGGGFLDTVLEGRTGVFVDEPPRPDAMAAGLEQMAATVWDAEAIQAHAATFSADRFIRRLHDVADAEFVALQG